MALPSAVCRNNTTPVATLLACHPTRERKAVVERWSNVAGTFAKDWKSFLLPLTSRGARGRQPTQRHYGQETATQRGDDFHIHRAIARGQSWKFRIGEAVAAFLKSIDRVAR
jgi:hypothetical protein